MEGLIRMNYKEINLKKEFDNWLVANEEFIFSLNKYEAMKAAFKKGYNLATKSIIENI